ncbi:MAG: sugar-binding transcriptional regulator [Acuticoccus sp.]
MGEKDRNGGEGEAGAADWPEQLAVRIAWCYYSLGLTQQEIASRLGLTRVRVNRLLAEARRRGIVKITITSRLAENVELEEELKTRYGLANARVVLAMGDEIAIAETLGAAGAEMLAGDFRDGTTIGMGWGVTLRAFADAVPERALADAAVVAMMGSLTQRSSINRFVAATVLAHRLQAECFYVPGPIICDSEESRRTLESQPLMREVQERAARADIAIVSVGGLDSGTLHQAGFIDEVELKSVRQAGALGNFLGHYIDTRAQIIDHPINCRVLGMRPDRLKSFERCVMISGGEMKVPALRAILNAGLVTDIVTDQASARSLLEPD